MWICGDTVQPITVSWMALENKDRWKGHHPCPHRAHATLLKVTHDERGTGFKRKCSGRCKAFWRGLAIQAHSQWAHLVQGLSRLGVFQATLCPFSWVLAVHNRIEILRGVTQNLILHHRLLEKSCGKGRRPLVTEVLEAQTGSCRQCSPALLPQTPHWGLAIPSVPPFQRRPKGRGSRREEGCSLEDPNLSLRLCLRICHFPLWWWRQPRVLLQPPCPTPGNAAPSPCLWTMAFILWILMLWYLGVLLALEGLPLPKVASS